MSETPVEKWLRADPHRTAEAQFLPTSGVFSVDLRENRRLCAEGYGATVEEATADACNDLMRRAGA